MADGSSAGGTEKTITETSEGGYALCQFLIAASKLSAETMENQQLLLRHTGQVESCMTTGPDLPMTLPKSVVWYLRKFPFRHTHRRNTLTMRGIKRFGTFRVPWGWTYTAGTVADWVAQFSFGFYSLMLTSLLLGLIVMVLYKPRTWCTFCPMGTMTQGICKLKNNEKK